MKINLGSGYKRFDGFINVDSNQQCKPDYVVDLEKDKLPFEDSSVDEIKAHHILEHIGSGFIYLMQEMYRVCEDGAIIDIQVPHHRHEVFFGDVTHIRPITIEALRQFSKKNNEHRELMWQDGSLFAFEYDVDFEIVKFNFKPDDVWLERFPTMEREQIEEVSRNFNNVYTETHILLAVVK
jgi:hypothetical protein